MSKQLHFCVQLGIPSALMALKRLHVHIAKIQQTKHAYKIPKFCREFQMNRRKFNNRHVFCKTAFVRVIEPLNWGNRFLVSNKASSDKSN